MLSTAGSDLHHDAERDLRDLGCAGIAVINNCQVCSVQLSPGSECHVLIAHGAWTCRTQHHLSTRSSEDGFSPCLAVQVQQQ